LESSEDEESVLFKVQIAKKKYPITVQQRRSTLVKDFVAEFVEKHNLDKNKTWVLISADSALDGDLKLGEHLPSNGTFLMDEN